MNNLRGKNKSMETNIISMDKWVKVKNVPKTLITPILPVPESALLEI